MKTTLHSADLPIFVENIHSDVMRPQSLKRFIQRVMAAIHQVLTELSCKPITDYAPQDELTIRARNVREQLLLTSIYTDPRQVFPGIVQ